MTMTNGDLREPEQPATTADWTAFEFEPVPAEELRAAPSYADWVSMSRTHLVTLALAWKILGASKEELKKFVRENADNSALDELLKNLASAKRTFECLGHATGVARARLICAGSAAELEAQPQPLMSVKAA
jgi:hypothetical protein